MQHGIALSVIALAMAGAALGCSNSNSASGDAGANDAACAKIDSACGQPCDMGNSLGVGQFCLNISDCNQTTQAHLCSTLGSSLGGPPTYFCTFECLPPGTTAADGGPPALPTDCGQAATCRCEQGDGGSCGCVPASCQHQ